MQLAEFFNVLHIERMSNPDFAKVFPKLEAPEAHLTTATESSQIRGIAWHYANVMVSVQSAYDKDLLSRDKMDGYIRGFANTLEQWPGYGRIT